MWALAYPDMESRKLRLFEHKIYSRRYSMSMSRRLFELFLAPARIPANVFDMYHKCSSSGLRSPLKPVDPAGKPAFLDVLRAYLFVETL